MSTSEIYRACRERLAAVSPRPSIIRFMGEVRDRPADPYIAERFAVLEWDQRAIGARGPVEKRGSYTISIFYPPVEGVVNLYSLHAALDAVLASFRRGAVLISGARPVNIIGVTPASPPPDNGWHYATVTARWERFDPPPA